MQILNGGSHFSQHDVIVRTSMAPAPEATLEMVSKTLSSPSSSTEDFWKQNKTHLSQGANLHIDCGTRIG